MCLCRQHRPSLCLSCSISVRGLFLDFGHGFPISNALTNRTPYRTCWAYAQTCEDGQDPGADQIYCSNKGQNTKWCCQDQETCTLNGHQVNVCIGGFDNPNANIDPADAEQELYSVIPSSKIVTTEPAQVTPSVFSTSTFATGSVSSSSTSSSTASSATPTTHSSGVSGGAIGGIVVGVLAGLAIICGTLIYVVVHRRRANRASVAAETKPNEKPLLTDEKYYLPPSSPQDRSSKQYTHQNNTYMTEAPSDAAFQGPTEMEGSRYNAPGTAPPHHELP